MEGIKVNVTTENNEVVIREGSALPLKEQLIIIITGILFCVQAYLVKYNTKASKDAVVIVDRDDMSISYKEDPLNHYGTKITGKLELSQTFKKFGINKGETWTPQELADLIRVNRSYFEPISSAANLVKELRNFKAKVDTEIEKSDDKRANTTVLRRQAVESNLPAAFKMKLPIFKGTDSEVIEVEVDINADDFSCQLVSPMAAEIIQTTCDKLIDQEIKAIEKLIPNVPIIEV